MAKNAQQRSIQVYAGWVDLVQPKLMGHFTLHKCEAKKCFLLNMLKSGSTPGMFRTLIPIFNYTQVHNTLEKGEVILEFFWTHRLTAWGRVLMDRREALLARRGERKARTLFETDYLLGVFDGHRTGALRFKEDDAGDFLNNNKEMASPPWTSIRELEEASMRLEEDDLDETEKMKWPNMLMAPGASLGGTRPKASVLDAKGQLWIAKFPSRNDNKDVGAWEKVVHDLAVESGLHVADAMTGTYYSKQHTFLTKRFDRNAKGERTHFASARTLLGQTDGTNFQSSVSYLDLAGFIMQNGAKADQDLDLAREVAPYFRISTKRAEEIIRWNKKICWRVESSG